MRLADIVTYAVLGFMGVRLVSGLRTSRSASGKLLVVDVVRGIRWRHVWPVPLVLPIVLTAATVLMSVPGLSWGWWSAFGGDGNPVFGSSDTTVGTAWEWIIPMVFMCLLLPALPLFAYAEERLFRMNAERWSWPRRAFKVVQFGLVHAIIGIPIGAALALSLGGAYFMGVYLRSWHRSPSRREATLESTRAHTVYNGLIVVLVLVAVTYEAFV